MTIDVKALNGRPNANQVRIYIQHRLFFERSLSFLQLLSFINLKRPLCLCGQHGNLEALSEHPSVV
jgi:hypothetical protein